MKFRLIDQPRKYMTKLLAKDIAHSHLVKANFLTLAFYLLIYQSLLEFTFATIY